MIQRHECFGLLLEAAKTIGVCHEIFRQHLHRHVAIEPRVPRAKEFAHPARAQRGSDLVGRKNLFR